MSKAFLNYINQPLIELTNLFYYGGSYLFSLLTTVSNLLLDTSGQGEYVKIARTIQEVSETEKHDGIEPTSEDQHRSFTTVSNIPLSEDCVEPTKPSKIEETPKSEAERDGEEFTSGSFEELHAKIQEIRAGIQRANAETQKANAETQKARAITQEARQIGAQLEAKADELEKRIEQNNAQSRANMAEIQKRFEQYFAQLQEIGRARLREPSASAALQRNLAASTQNTQKVAKECFRNSTQEAGRQHEQ
jgi:SMC interacting uncharacterized protein involved in chromosome segregation